jgi:phosphoribosylformimino-5-aminoimidazole carboxamide ribotide isomerase
MIFLPAIDLMDGKCVRLLMGRKEQKKEYSNRPAEVAMQFETQGAHGIHVVDLDGAFTGRAANSKRIGEIAKAVSIPVEVGGGIRSTENIDVLFALGVSRAILGTSAVQHPDLVDNAIAQYGSDRILVGIDAREGMVAVQGWEEKTAVTAAELALDMKKRGVETIIYTDIAKDGMLTGPNIEGTRKLAQQSGLRVIASGGVNSLEDIRQLLSIEKYGVVGFISGKAVYEGRFTVQEVVQMLGRA